MEKLFNSLKKLKNNVFGYISFDYNKKEVVEYSYSIVEQKKRNNGIEQIPFYFVAKKDGTEPIIALMNKEDNTIDYLPNQGEINSVWELIRNIKNNMGNYLTELTNTDRNEVRKNPQYKEDYEALVRFCDLSDVFTSYFFSELTTFTFPRNLLDMLRGMTNVPYEACGTINISKLKPQERTKLENIPEFKTDEDKLAFIKEREAQFIYDVSFHVDFPESCDLSFVRGADINFHTHPRYKNEDLSGFSGNIKLLHIENFIHQVFNVPSSHDISFIRKKLSNGSFQVVMIFNFYGFYIFQNQGADLTELDNLSAEEIKDYNNEIYNTMLSSLYDGPPEIFENLKKSRNENDSANLLKNMEKILLNINKNIKIDTYLPFKGASYTDTKTLENFISKNYIRIRQTYDNILNVVDKFINLNPKKQIYRNFYLIEKNNRNEWQYPQISVDLYPQLKGFVGTTARRRLTFQSS